MTNPEFEQAVVTLGNRVLDKHTDVCYTNAIADLEKHGANVKDIPKPLELLLLRAVKYGLHYGMQNHVLMTEEVLTELELAGASEEQIDKFIEDGKEADDHGND